MHPVRDLGWLLHRISRHLTDQLAEAEGEWCAQASELEQDAAQRRPVRRLVLSGLPPHRCRPSSPSLQTDTWNCTRTPTTRSGVWCLSGVVPSS